MADKLSQAARSANMARVRGSNTRPELLVRRLVHGLGYRYRLHARDLPGTPDLVFRRRKKVIFVHGCFWHGHPGCPRAARPQSNAEFWNEKLTRNLDRDAAQVASLEAAGWRVFVVWECETRDKRSLGERVRAFLNS